MFGELETYRGRPEKTQARCEALLLRYETLMYYCTDTSITQHDSYAGISERCLLNKYTKQPILQCFGNSLGTGMYMQLGIYVFDMRFYGIHRQEQFCCY